MIQRISSDAHWENIYGYSRAVKTGNIIEISGTTSTKGDEVVGKGDYYEQTRFILEKITAILKEAGSSVNKVIRTRTYVCDISQWQKVAKAHYEVFGEHRPSATLVEVNRLIGPELLVEIEVSAVTEKV